jgi:flagellar hook-associated protein 3 FlgL
MDLQRSKERSAILSEQISSGNRIVRPEDDPSGSALILDFQNSIEKNTQYLQQATSAESFLQVTETSLTSLNDSLTRIMELGPTATSTSTDANGRAALAAEINGLRNTILSLSNTQEQGKYIFAGTRTLTQPFSGPAAGPIAYAGDSNSIDMDVSATASVTTNLTGDQAFFGGAGGQGTASDLFQQVTDLRDALTANNIAGVQAAVTNITSIRQRVVNQITDLGGRQNSLIQLKTDLGAYNASLESIQSTYQTVDYPTAISSYTTEQTIQQAAMSMIAKGSSTNLFDYIG